MKKKKRIIITEAQLNSYINKAHHGELDDMLNSISNNLSKLKMYSNAHSGRHSAVTVALDELIRLFKRAVISPLNKEINKTNNEKL